MYENVWICLHEVMVLEIMKLFLQNLNQYYLWFFYSVILRNDVKVHFEKDGCELLKFSKKF